MSTTYIEQTKQEFLAHHKGLSVSFTSYYKYKFYFTCMTGDQTNPSGVLSLSYGGCSEDIYRFDLGATDVYAVGDLDWSYGEYKDWDTGITYSFCE